MKLIEEIVVDAFLPTVRSMLAESLRERGFTQREVATALGISQSAVSKYAHGTVERHPVILDDPRVQELVETIADGLASGEMSQVQAVVELEVFIRQLERGDLLARLHEEAMPELASYDLSFSIHDPDSDLRASEQVLASLKRGLRLLEQSRGFVSLIPNVGSNLVECLPDATSISEVAGIPGRLFDVTGELSIPADPEFGASEHVALVLLASRDAGGEHRAAINIRYSPEFIQRLNDAGYRSAEFTADYSDVSQAISEVFEPDASVLYQTGGFGIEPIIYVLGSSVEETVNRVLTVTDNG